MSQGETPYEPELPDYELADKFQAAVRANDISNRDELGRTIMERILNRIGRSDLVRKPLIIKGGLVRRNENEPASFTDYLTYSIDHGHGADATILDFLRLPVPEDPASDPNFKNCMDGIIIFVELYVEQLNGPS